MDFSFFITDNKSGYKTQEKWFLKNHPTEYAQIINYSKNLNIDLSFKEKIWFYFNNLKERPRCLTCNKEIKFRNRFDKPYGEFCSLSCINKNKEEMIKRQKSTFRKKYNVDFYTQHKDFIKKQKETKFQKYGNANYNNNEKVKITKRKRYGNENYSNIQKYKTTSMKKYGSENYCTSESYKKKITEKYRLLYPDINFNKIEKFFVTIFCKKCEQLSTISKQLLYERYKRKYVICTHCNPIGQSNRSGYEIEISETLKQYQIKVNFSDKKILKGQEIDILFPDHKLGVEIDGLYWHNELFVENDYHLKKTIQSKEQGIELIHIFEDEWLYKKDIVLSILKNRLNLIDNVIYARKCQIKEVSSSESVKFLEENHIQGGVKSKIRIGLYYKDKMVSLMTFSKGRIIMGGKSNEWELTRFCNKIDTNVIGSASKLFSYFIKNYNPQKVVSYSDLRIFGGGMYNKLGFKEISQSKPNYWYVINGLRYHRFNFRKSILVKEGYNKNKTEKEIMFDRKIYRIYDCGHIRWEYNIL